MTNSMAKVKLGRKEFHVDCEEIDAGSCGISAADCAALGACMRSGGFNRVKIMILVRFERVGFFYFFALFVLTTFVAQFANNLGDQEAELITEGLRFNSSVQELDLVSFFLFF